MLKRQTQRKRNLPSVLKLIAFIYMRIIAHQGTNGYKSLCSESSELQPLLTDCEGEAVITHHETFWGGLSPNLDFHT